jgi:hypothetical protein
MAKSESMDEMVARRNKRLMNIFNSNNIQIRLIGDPHKPAIIKDECTLLSCYVKNFDLHFTKEPFSDEVVKTIKLKQEPEITKFELEDIIECCKHRPVFKIHLINSGLYLVGYNYLNQEDGEGRYPVFAKYKPKIYFDMSFAESVLKGLEEEGYPVEIC